MVLNAPNRWRCGLAPIMLLTSAIWAVARSEKPRRVFMITDMEGVDGIFSTELQCIPLQSPRFEESKKLLTGEVNAAVGVCSRAARRKWWCGTATIPAARSPPSTSIPKHDC